MKLAQSLAKSLAVHGLYVRGSTQLSAREIETYRLPENKNRIALVGNIGSSYWPIFSQSSEFQDNCPDPLDRWSRRIAQEISAAHSSLAIFPFEGPPYYPFQQWAQRAEALQHSPLGILIHPDYGLWHSYRFALLCDSQLLLPTNQRAESPCVSCIEQPCLNSCPAEAVSLSGYDVERCAGYLNQNVGAECHSEGCLARYACPIAADLSYHKSQRQFHLKAFL